MALFKLERNIAGWDRDERVAAGYRAVSCMDEFPNVRWIRSYIDTAQQHLTCLYSAPDREELIAQQAVAQLPWVDIQEVTEFEADGFYAEHIAARAMAAAANGGN